MQTVIITVARVKKNQKKNKQTNKLTHRVEYYNYLARPSRLMFIYIYIICIHYAAVASLDFRSSITSRGTPERR